MKKRIMPLEIVFSIVIIVIVISIIILICLQMKIEMQIINKNSEASLIASNILENMKTRSYDDIEKYIQEFSGIGVQKKIEDKLQNIIIYGDQFNEKFFGTEIPEEYTVEFDSENTSEFNIIKDVTVSVTFFVNGIAQVSEVNTVIEREKISECNKPVFNNEYFSNLNLNTHEYNIIPIKYSNINNSFVVTTKDDSEWYNYSAKKWAKVLIFSKYAEGMEDLFIDSNGIVKNSILYNKSNVDISNYIYVWIPNFSVKDNISYFRYGSGKKSIKMEFLYTNGNYLYLNKIAEEIKDISPECSFDGINGVWRKLSDEQDVYYNAFCQTKYGPIDLY